MNAALQSSVETGHPSILALPGHHPTGREQVGGKAWSVYSMQKLGIPVPPAFVISTEVCARYEAAGNQLPQDIIDALPQALQWLESQTSKTFGGGDNPLLVSVRSGAAISMPGMMDTILNLGMTDAVQTTLGKRTGSPEFAADVRERFTEHYQAIVGKAAPADPLEQLHGAIEAVLQSWQSQRARDYRRDRGLPESGGTAVTIQAMVFGNLGERSGTGVMFSRDPVNGSPTPYGEWLPRGQGEDVVSGRMTPQSLDALAEQQPEAHAALLKMSDTLERAGRDVQDIEFTIEAGRLWLLQTRSAKRTPAAAVRLAVALAEEGLITRSEALDRVTAEQVGQVLQPHVAPEALRSAKVLATGKLACPGVIAGLLVSDVDEAEQRALEGESIILTRHTTNPDDVHAMSVVAGVLTELGGATSHAAVVSREIGVPCIVGCGQDQLLPLGERWVTIDAERGEVYEGRLEIIDANAGEHADLQRLTDWARAESRASDDAPLAQLLQSRKASAAD
ncbi:pyruvate, phosphate dikinase (plasmid) [Diaphorobacter sp. HDW4B]|uniref:pyruvate, phosphate dikinase n=1 Tax=Diaphorobacter sp. HDW4B TaxID=2714925 RepID=UPI001408E201|nr:pyruvate, phosphate dikinase [Diaphorobacter sp. HDW4B]QIL74032.1 pyruvate, phosphate dikinase [Diaphorobacter sp. HDW4B]